ncbi:hypothetical protein JNB63_05540 [Microbacterium trichothecenolyticum]|uniref:hypothetical protein n=1 Tax=Microbacterium trichothecenolyticum TaxID=69370 RepID=UPI001C6EAEE2|nr:hypothetical protein [Microbacterium trichothecenolyticum]MBW9119551.1 hypothetical protein [Microbacterium trichothecenolyticum]
MKHVTYADKALFLDDESADWLMEYARALGVAGMTDSISLHAIGLDGNEVDVTFLLNSNTELITQTTQNSLSAPRNDEVVGYMQEQTRLIMSPPPARMADDPFDLH